MLGELIGETTGKMTGQRVIDLEGPTIETNVSSIGTLKGVAVTETLTFVSGPTSKGVIHGLGKGVVNTKDGQIATFTGEGIGRFDSAGVLKWRGALFCHTNSEGSLQFLDNMVGVFESNVDALGNFTDRIWEWK